MLPKEAMKEFKIIYAKIFRTELSDKEAICRANNLVALYAAVYGDNALKYPEDNKIIND